MRLSGIVPVKIWRADLEVVLNARALSAGGTSIEKKLIVFVHVIGAYLETRCKKHMQISFPLLFGIKISKYFWGRFLPLKQIYINFGAFYPDNFYGHIAHPQEK